MSQHYVYTELNGEKIIVLLGWDRPLSGYFMVVIKPIEKIDEDGESYTEDEYLYSNLEDRNLSFGLSQEPEYFKEILTKMAIVIPDEAFQIITNDGRLDVGNDVNFYDVVNGSLQLSKRCA